MMAVMAIVITLFIESNSEAPPPTAVGFVLPRPMAHRLAAYSSQPVNTAAGGVGHSH